MSEYHGLAQSLLMFLVPHFKNVAQPSSSSSSSSQQSVASVVRSTLGIQVAIHGESLFQFASLCNEYLQIPPLLPFELARKFPYIFSLLLEC